MHHALLVCAVHVIRVNNSCERRYCEYITYVVANSQYFFFCFCAFLIFNWSYWKHTRERECMYDLWYAQPYRKKFRIFFFFFLTFNVLSALWSCKCRATTKKEVISSLLFVGSSSNPVHTLQRNFVFSLPEQRMLQCFCRGRSSLEYDPCIWNPF